MTKNNFYVLSGAMGGGKSAVLSRLRDFGIHCVPEPAREILAEQRIIKAMGVPEKNADLFSMLMLSRSIHDYYENSSVEESVVFDRGIPDAERKMSFEAAKEFGVVVRSIYENLRKRNHE
jgi:predicted ATPase